MRFLLSAAFPLSLHPTHLSVCLSSEVHITVFLSFCSLLAYKYEDRHKYFTPLFKFYANCHQTNEENGQRALFKRLVCFVAEANLAANRISHWSHTLSRDFEQAFLWVRPHFCNFSNILKALWL